MDPDHRLLLRNTKPLLQSRNAAVSSIAMSKHIFTLLSKRFRKKKKKKNPHDFSIVVIIFAPEFKLAENFISYTYLIYLISHTRISIDNKLLTISAD